MESFSQQQTKGGGEKRERCRMGNQIQKKSALALTEAQQLDT